MKLKGASTAEEYSYQWVCTGTAIRTSSSQLLKAQFGHVCYNKLQLLLKVQILPNQAAEQWNVDGGDTHAGSPDTL